MACERASREVAKEKKYRQVENDREPEGAG